MWFDVIWRLFKITWFDLIWRPFFIIWFHLNFQNHFQNPIIESGEMNDTDGESSLRVFDRCHTCLWNLNLTLFVAWFWLRPKFRFQIQIKSWFDIWFDPDFVPHDLIWFDVSQNFHDLIWDLFSPDLTKQRQIQYLCKRTKCRKQTR